jgi:hypothetical protein
MRQLDQLDRAPAICIFHSFSSVVIVAFCKRKSMNLYLLPTFLFPFFLWVSYELARDKKITSGTRRFYRKMRQPTAKNSQIAKLILKKNHEYRTAMIPTCCTAASYCLWAGWHSSGLEMIRRLA